MAKIAYCYICKQQDHASGFCGRCEANQYEHFEPIIPDMLKQLSEIAHLLKITHNVGKDVFSIRLSEIENILNADGGIHKRFDEFGKFLAGLYDKSEGVRERQIAFKNLVQGKEKWFFKNGKSIMENLLINEAERRFLVRNTDSLTKIVQDLIIAIGDYELGSNDVNSYISKLHALQGKFIPKEKMDIKVDLTNQFTNPQIEALRRQEENIPGLDENERVIKATPVLIPTPVELNEIDSSNPQKSGSVRDMESSCAVEGSSPSPDSKIHELKIIPKYFQPLLERTKNFEIRYNDRDFKVGDYLRLKEYDYEKSIRYTGRELVVIVTYILRAEGSFFSFLDDYIIMAIRHLKK